MEWRFEKLTDSQSRVSPNQDEFFRNKEDAFNAFSQSLIREDVQNRLDARAIDTPPDKPVRIRYFLSTSGANGDDKIKRWFSGLEEHCNSQQCLEGLFESSRDCFHKPFRYLTIECFNTTGLLGDPAMFNEGKFAEEIKLNDFYWMFRNVGRSGKARLKGKRGSWGIGKIVYHMASETMTYLCYSVTKDRFTLMGKTQLVPHWIGEQAYHTEGFLADYSKLPNVPMPVEDIESDEAKQFAEDFGLKRTKNDCGTSTVVPFCVKDLTMAGLAKATIMSYLWEILKGRVRVEIETDTGEEDVVLEVGSVKDDIERFFSEKTEDDRAEKAKYMAFVDFYEAIIKYQRGGLKLPTFDLAKPTNLTTALGDVKALFGNPLEFERAKKAYSDGEIIAINANVEVKPKSKDSKPIPPLPASFKVYLQRGEMEKPQVSLIRDGLTILELPRHRDTMLRALTLVEPTGDTVNPLSDFIRSAESPAHSDLTSDRPLCKREYNNGGVLLKYVCDLMYVLAGQFSDVAGKEDREALMDYFSIDLDDTAGEKKQKHRKRRGKKRGSQQKPTKPIVHTPSFFKIWDRWPEGVKVTTDNPPAADTLPRRLQLKMAYSVEGEADPFKRYDLADFDCRAKGNIVINATGCKAIAQEPNRVTFEITDPQFAIEMRGFGAKRDVMVDAREIKIKPEEEEEVEA